MQTDWAVGEVLAALDKAGLASNTLVIFTSDNGCSPAAKIPELEAKGHFPSADSPRLQGGHLGRRPPHSLSSSAGRTDQGRQPQRSTRSA